MTSREYTAPRNNYDRVKTAQSFSSETICLIRAMMEEHKVSMTKRKQLMAFIERGQPLPPLQPQGQNKEEFVKLPEISLPTVLVRRRCQASIVQTGAYERDKFVADNKVLGEVEKRRLQSLMAFGTGAMTPQDTAAKYENQQIDEQSRDRFKELAAEARERCEFLQEVATLGQAAAYKDIIEAEVAAKLRAMRVVDPQRYEEWRQRGLLPKIPINLR